MRPSISIHSADNHTGEQKPHENPGLPAGEEEIVMDQHLAAALNNRQPIEPLAFSIEQACAAAGVGRSKLYLAVQSGDLRARKLGKKTLILRDDLRAWLESLPSFTPWSSPSGAAPTAGAKARRRHLVAAE
jgi:excisionase family DNA binding protein